MSVFVHLAYGYDARKWEARWTSGDLLGFNERFPYGYHLARDMGCTVRYSHDRNERLPSKLARLAVRAVAGFDLVHAWRNRRSIMAADVVWTHTESQHLAIALVLKILRPENRPRIVGQSVWLIDRWPQLSWLRRLVYRWLIAEVDALTFLSPLNAERARGLFGPKKCRFIRFGISAGGMLETAAPRYLEPVRVLAIGNDRHRDWACLAEAFRGERSVVLDVVSQTAPRRVFAGMSNVRIHSLRKQADLLQLYREAHVVVIPLRENLHASGISCLQEAVIAGRPAVCSRVGGLPSYFSEQEVAFVEPGDSDLLRERVLAIARDPASEVMARRAQRRMNGSGLGSMDYVRQHVELSHALIASGARHGVHDGSIDLSAASLREAAR